MSHEIELSNGKKIAELINANHCDDKTGAAMTEAITRAFAQMALTDAQVQLLLEELQKPSPSLSFDFKAGQDENFNRMVELGTDGLL